MKLYVTKFLCAALMTIVASEISEKRCVDELDAATCSLLAKYGACKTHESRMKRVCRKSCNFCALETACSSKKCPYMHECLIDDNDTAYCHCTAKCSTVEKKSGTICARNGVTYKSICAMKMDQCQRKNAIKVYHYGDCIHEDRCVDFLQKQCATFAEKKLCLVSPMLMQFYCPATCRLCRQPAPPPLCSKSRHGCCWNTNKPALGPNHEGCKACEDKSFCPAFKQLCGSYKNIGSMRQACPKTCGYC